MGEFAKATGPVPVQPVKRVCAAGTVGVGGGTLVAVGTGARVAVGEVSGGRVGAIIAVAAAAGLAAVVATGVGVAVAPTPAVALGAANMAEEDAVSVGTAPTGVVICVPAAAGAVCSCGLLPEHAAVAMSKAQITKRTTGREATILTSLMNSSLQARRQRAVSP
ncbi:MAG: hypothetical protein EXR44_02465 [Dehalococcoidia bacterium]|nr:hypothetical protein [Dehalococcoidia bacterium]